jgi:hypothetical protein
MNKYVHEVHPDGSQATRDEDGNLLVYSTDSETWPRSYNGNSISVEIEFTSSISKVKVDFSKCDLTSDSKLGIFFK